jgi:hypothetical protein
VDGERFDDLVRWLETGRSRRTLTRLLGSGALVAPLIALTLGDTSGKGKGKGKGKKKKPCAPCKKRKQGKCKGKQPVGTLCAGGTCDGNGSCRSPSGTVVPPPPPGSSPPPPGCTPEPPETTCAGALCGTARNNNCGQAVACGCPSGQTCLLNGTCVRTCTTTAQCVDCAPSPFCSTLSSDGQSVCVGVVASCSGLQECGAPDSPSCPQGFVCLDCSGPIGFRCFPVADCPPT